MIEITKSKITVFQYKEMLEWCRTTIGKESWWPGDNLHGKWRAYSVCDNFGPVKMMQWAGDVTFTFNHEEDCVLFCLKWN